jgi:hypothetical protein
MQALKRFNFFLRVHTLATKVGVQLVAVANEAEFRLAPE